MRSRNSDTAARSVKPAKVANELRLMKLEVRDVSGLAPILPSTCLRHVVLGPDKSSRLGRAGDSCVRTTDACSGQLCQYTALPLPVAGKEWRHEVDANAFHRRACAPTRGLCVGSGRYLPDLSACSVWTKSACGGLRPSRIPGTAWLSRRHSLGSRIADRRTDQNSLGRQSWMPHPIFPSCQALDPRVACRFKRYGPVAGPDCCDRL